MAADGVIPVANGFGSKRRLAVVVVAGGGKRVAILTRGMDPRGVMSLVRGRSRRLAFGGLYRVRTTAAVRHRHRHRIGATAVSKVTFTCVRRPNVRRMALDVTIYQKKRSNTAGLTGHALTKK